VDAGPATPASTAHCHYEPIPATAHAGTPVADGTLYAGTGEGVVHVPIGVTLGAYAGRAEGAGNDGFIDARRTEIAGAFAASVGIETGPHARALVISTGCTGTPADTDACGDTVVIFKLDVAIGYQGLTHEVERRLGPDFAGHVVISTSHSHSTFANYTGHQAMQVAFGPFRRSVFDAAAADLESVARQALGHRVPARLGITHDGSFDLDDRVTRDRRDENDMLAGGRRDDHDLFVLRVDAYDPAAPTDPSTPMALVAVFGMHGTIHGGDNVLLSNDAPGGIERVLEEQFDHPVLVMHLQGAGGDVSPVGLEGGTECPSGSVLCHDYAREETVGLNAVDAIMAAHTAAGSAMLEHTSMEMVTRSIERGPDWTRFTVRNGALSYMPWDGRRPCDGNVLDAMGNVISPIDEFNAPTGAALCGGGSAPYVPTARMPGTTHLTDWPYASCNRIEAVQHLLSTVLSLDLGDTAPICDTTRTTVSALRIGDWYFSVLPGEPLTLSADRMRALVPSVPPDHHVVLGYAQDNNGYIMLAEDWLRGGYEPTITFWGPLDGEQILERVATDLYPLLDTPMRENAAASDTHVRVESPPEDFIHMDPSPMAGTVPAAVPSYLTTRLLPAMPTSTQVPATVRRLESVFFTWIGADPLEGTPEITIEQRQSDGSFAPLRRRSGRVVTDGDFLLSWTPDPLNHDPAMPSAPRTHYWTVEWQAVPSLGQPGLEALSARAGLPLGTYRIVVVGPTYSLHSNEFDVVAGTLEVSRTGGTGTMVEADVGYHAPSGYRLLDAQAGATRFAPIRMGTVDLLVTDAGGATHTMTGIATDRNGHVSFDAGAGATSVRFTDAFGNTGTLTL
jgi:neutral ceramidase